MGTGIVITRAGKFFEHMGDLRLKLLVGVFYTVLFHLRCTLKLHQGHPQCADKQYLSCPNIKNESQNYVIT